MAEMHVMQSGLKLANAEKTDIMLKTASRWTELLVVLHV